MGVTSVIGTARRRRDGEAKVLGQTRYVGDMPVHGLLHARPVLAAEAHAQLISDRRERGARGSRRRRGADGGRPAAEGRLRARRRAAGARGDRLVRPAGRARDRRDRGGGRGRRARWCGSTPSRCRRCSTSRPRWPTDADPVARDRGRGRRRRRRGRARRGRRRGGGGASELPPNVAVRQRLANGDVDGGPRARRRGRLRPLPHELDPPGLPRAAVVRWPGPSPTARSSSAPARRARSWSARAWRACSACRSTSVRVQAAPLGGAFGGKLMISEPLAAAAALEARPPGAARVRPQRGLRRRQPGARAS